MLILEKKFFTQKSVIIFTMTMICSYYLTLGSSPSFRPGHCHNSVFHFDMHVDGRTFCDSGIYEYSNTSIRNNLRSTSAHNTVKINDSELNEIWDSFKLLKAAQSIISKLKKNLFKQTTTIILVLKNVLYEEV